MNDSEVFRTLLTTQTVFPLTADQVDRAVRFRERACIENETQNLTRLLSPEDFFEGHVLDVLHLKKTGWITGRALDLGSGMGVPGLLSAILFDENWVLSDSEKSKADFMSRIIDEFNLKTAVATSQRAEEYLFKQGLDVKIIVSRAVGSVTKLYGWLSPRSTWNTLILFKGPKWTEEWSEFSNSSKRNRLGVVDEYSYEVGADKKRRVLVRIERKK